MQYSKNTNTSNLSTIKSKVDSLELDYKILNEQTVKNLKEFDDITLNNKQTFETINRNLDDIQKILTKDLQRFNQNVDKSILYHEAIFDRIQKDVQYLSDDQQNLHKKLTLIDKRITVMEEQIGQIIYQ